MRNKKDKRTGKAKPGPKPETLKLKGEWHRAIKRSLAKRKPPEGWPK